MLISKFSQLKTAKPFYRAMINPGTLLAVAAGVIAYSTFSKASAATKLIFYPAAIKDLYFEGATPVIKLHLAIQNTSNQKMILKSFAGEVSVNGFHIGNISNFVPVAIQPNQQTILPLTIRLSLIGVVQDIISAFKKTGASQVITLTANANVDHFQIPITIKYKIG